VEQKKIPEGLQPRGWSPKGWSPLGPDLFLQLSLQIPIIDVRAPEEYLQGHIPGAINLPLFDDDERAAVGITYTRTGRDAAMLKGLEISGPKLQDFVRQAKKITSTGELLLHCWRGGMRSEAMAWLFTFSGIKTTVLEGGYKAYRRYIRQSFTNGQQVLVLGGMTGSGKTETLKHLSSLGEQVLDLEALAHHKGSAFGALGQADQPTNEQFENDLAHQWLALDSRKPVWIEDESRNIGKVIIPEQLFIKMSTAPLAFIDIPFEIRVERLMKEYGGFDAAMLSSLIDRISKRIGGDIANSAKISLRQGDIKNAVSIVLAYYDKTYQYGISKRDKSKITTISFAAFQRGFAELSKEFKI